MKKGILIFFCFLLALRAVKSVIIFGHLNTFFVSNESTAFHSGQITGLIFNVLASLGLSIWFWKKYSVRLSK